MANGIQIFHPFLCLSISICKNGTQSKCSCFTSNVLILLQVFGKMNSYTELSHLVVPKRAHICARTRARLRDA